jgi:asparaginyl-tRNA synthetase
LIEVEEIFSDMHEKMNLLESLIKFMTKELLINHSQELKNLIIYRNLAKHPNNEFLKIHTLKTEFWENIEIEHEQQKKFLNKIIFKKNFPRLAYKDVNKEFQEKGEYFETSHLREKRGEYLTSLHDSPVFVTEFPFMTRHFYDKKHSENEIYTYTFDLIGHGGYGEIASGSEREYRADIVEAQMHEKKLRKDNNQTLQWYYKQQRFGSVPHAGFSIGLERMTAWLTQTGNIADIVGFPRRIVGNDINY